MAERGVLSAVLPMPRPELVAAALGVRVGSVVRAVLVPPHQELAPEVLAAADRTAALPVWGRLQLRARTAPLAATVLGVLVVGLVVQAPLPPATVVRVRRALVPVVAAAARVAPSTAMVAQARPATSGPRPAIRRLPVPVVEVVVRAATAMPRPVAQAAPEASMAVGRAA